MVCMQQEQHVQRLLQHRVRLVVRLALVVELVQERAGVGEPGRWGDKVAALAHSVRHRGERRGLADEPVDLLVHYREGHFVSLRVKRLPCAPALRVSVHL